MKRKFYDTLLNWKEKSNEPLMVVGVRQTGKTYIIDKFCQENYANYLYINLEREKDIRDIFEDSVDPDKIIRRIEINKQTKIDIDNTIIFFDEIQASEKAITSLKYFCEDKNNYHIVCAGSLLGVKLNRFKSSFPVGKVTIKYLYPMDFEEFLWAANRGELAQEIKTCFLEKRKMLDSFHEMSLELYREYLCIGGMPRAVKNFIDNSCNLMAFDRNIHEDIIASYLADMSKYTYNNSESVKIQNIYNSIPSQLAKDNKKFKYSVVDKRETKKSLELPMDWLLSSGLVLKCNLVKKQEIPLKVYIDDDIFKIYLSDVGLLNFMCGLTFKDIMENGTYMFKGAITENYVACALASKRYNLFYWKSNGEAEVDFILDNDGIIPVEVKANDSTKSKSLNEYITKYNPKYAIRVSTKNFGFYNDIFSVPLYAVHLL